MTKTTDQWHDEIADLEYGVALLRQEVRWSQQMDEDPFTLEELRVALRGAQARLAERQRRHKAAQTVKAKGRRS